MTPTAQEKKAALDWLNDTLQLIGDFEGTPEHAEKIRALLEPVAPAKDEGKLIVGFDMAAPEGDLSCLMIGNKRKDGTLEIQHFLYGAEAEALYRALHQVPALRAALLPSDTVPLAVADKIKDLLEDIADEGTSKSAKQHYARQALTALASYEQFKKGKAP